MFHKIKKDLFFIPVSLGKKIGGFCLQGFKKGDENEFSKLYERFNKPILNYVRSRIENGEVAKEVTQDVFVKVFRFRDSYQECNAFSTWLWTIARNTVSDHLRGAQPAQESPVSPEDLPSPQKCAESLVLRKDERRKYFKMMKSLTRLQKRVLWMRFIHHLSYDEISKRLGLSLSAVKNLAYRAKLTLTESSLSFA